jgi:para-aminobenzoate synthetase/4-amino-4-deoxychorismate lyase
MDSAAPHSAAGPFSLLETMRLEDGRVRRLERHLLRLSGAAAWFRYPWHESAVRREVASVAAAHAHACWRLRLLLGPDGVPAVECTPHAPGSPARWRVAFAPSPIDAGDPFVLNKTTRRIVYDTARRARPDVDDVLLWNDRGEVTESTIANVVAEIDGRRWTPPVICGLLAGTFRAEQLEAGTIHERVLGRADLVSASRLWLINSVREWMDAELVEAGA